MAVGVAVDHRAAEFEVAYAALQLVRRAAGVLHGKMREAVIAVRPLGDFAGQKIVGLARAALRHRRVALALHSRPGDRKNGAGNARAIHRPEPRLAEIGEAGQDATRYLRVNVADRRPPVFFVTGCQEMLFKRNLADHAFLVSPHASGV